MLSLITSAVDDNIILSVIYEYGEIPSTKFLWDVLEMKHSLKEGNDAEDIALDNDPIFGCETEDAMMGDECVSVIETCNDENTCIIVESKSFPDVEPESFPDAEIKFDETYISHDEWINLMIEKHLIDELLLGENMESVQTLIHTNFYTPSQSTFVIRYRKFNHVRGYLFF